MRSYRGEKEQKESGLLSFIVDCHFGSMLTESFICWILLPSPTVDFTLRVLLTPLWVVRKEFEHGL